MLPLAYREVFLILEDGFFNSRRIIVNTIDPVRNLPYKVF